MREKVLQRDMRANWYVITGGPSSGKSTILEKLRDMGYRIIPETARVLIDEELSKGKQLAEIRGDKRAFQQQILQMKLEIENELPKDEVIFFERGMPDSVAYFSVSGLDPKEALDVCEKNLYQKVFLMDLLPFEQDYARTEDVQTTKRIHQLLRVAYEQLEYEVISVPVMPVENRAKFILDNIDPKHRL